jgi:TonB family protein
MLLRPVLIAVVLVSATIAAAAGPREPTGKWIVNFADAQCIAYRDYGAKGSPRLLIKAPPLGDVMQVAVLREAGRTSAEQVDAFVAIDQRRPLKTNLLVYTPKDAKERVYLLNLPSADFTPVRQARTLSVRSEGLNETFALSQMEPLLKVMDDCLADLRKVFHIGADGAEPTELQSRAKANLVKLFSSNDYPGVAIVNRQSGRVKFALLIGEDGRVADCTVVETSGVAALDSQACALLKIRAKFEPALGRDGKPAKDAVVGSIVWRM